MLSKLQQAAKTVQQYVSVYGQLRAAQADPVIVYQMGKVGSTSIAHSLKQAGRKAVFQVHRMHPHTIASVQAEHGVQKHFPAQETMGELLYKKLIVPQQPIKVITLVREPISRNISAFFQNLPYFIEPQDLAAGPLQQRVEQLVDCFLHTYPHQLPLTWFDVEFQPTLGIDIYNQPFPIEQGYQVFAGGHCEVLLLKTELQDRIKEGAIAQFLQLDSFRLIRANVGQDKDYADLYSQFKRHIKLPDAYINQMCSAPYTRHFYSEGEIERIRALWTK